MEGKHGHIIDLSSLEALFREHYQALCQAAYFVTGSEDVARDMVQDFFFLCWNRRNELLISGDFRSYAMKAVRNASLNYLRSNRKFSFTDDPELGNRDAEPQRHSFDKEAEERRNKALWDAIGRLPEQRRAIFLSSNKDDLTYAQIAEKFEISVNTVKTQIRLAYQFLRQECSWLVYSMLVILFLKFF
ncbi:sigma-70 family RNA polymerase sigma factor [Pseudoflavitalea sp. G-6-1-2]|uniref:sigma-70 family RNA polymerase sigma factor n=1 Tax=Pseudoflavitalea sp. G-6-1-2 TaxID=2728841 RepID=UPI00146D9930|nr:sigma-70 family RNA polymerase sigma factor [Pseudoflavitalea sp. G-6-1-2]NML21635.1 sigma-70 family RNA polymerase sigma factor [Pseudoflavitalea sp. G-6-1-2]